MPQNAIIHICYSYNIYFPRSTISFAFSLSSLIYDKAGMSFFAKSDLYTTNLAIKIVPHKVSSQVSHHFFFCISHWEGSSKKCHGIQTNHHVKEKKVAMLPNHLAFVVLFYSVDAKRNHACFIFNVVVDEHIAPKRTRTSFVPRALTGLFIRELPGTTNMSSTSSDDDVEPNHQTPSSFAIQSESVLTGATLFQGETSNGTSCYLHTVANDVHTFTHPFLNYACTTL